MAAIKLILGLVAICWTAFAAFLYFTQHSHMYQPRPADPVAETLLMNELPGLDVFVVLTPDGQSLTGWQLTRKQGRGVAPGLVYFGGNAEDAGDFMRQAALYPGFTLIAVNYRGYGRSTGTPSQEALLEDALAVYDQAVAATGGPGVVMGRSLGAGMAARVAANRPVAGVVLVTPYDSLLNVAKEHYPFMPVTWLLKEPYDAVPDAMRATAPMIAFTANLDSVISPERGRALFDAWKGTDKTFVRVPSAGHNDITQFTTYKQEVLRFLKELTG